MEKAGYIILDFETTGLLDDNPEVLQVAAIDESGNVLISEYCRPENVTSWKAAQSIHGISPEKVADCPTFREYLPKLLEIIGQKSAVIAYNAAYERGVLSYYGVDVDNVVFIDPMLMFAYVYGDYSQYFGDYLWQTLATAARYYGYEFEAHDALEDVRATKFVYNKMIEAGEAVITV